MGCFQCFGRARRLEDKYEILELLGEGKTGQVYRGKSRQNGREVAVKFVRYDYLSTSNRQQALQQELLVLSIVRHSAIIRLRDIFQDDEQYAIVTDLSNGGELLNVIHRNTSLRLSERTVAGIVRQLLHALVYLHHRGITHRDLKVENIMCKTDSLEDGISIIDFGLAHEGTVGEADMTGMNGTCHYMAPEMFGKNSQYGCQVDIWAVGVVTYILLFGEFPFDAKFMSQVEDKIIAGEYEIPRELDQEVTNDAKKFLKYLMAVRVVDRPPASMALQHPWLQKNTASPNEFSDKHMHKIRGFVESRRPTSATTASAKKEAYQPPLLPSKDKGVP